MDAKLGYVAVSSVVGTILVGIPATALFPPNPIAAIVVVAGLFVVPMVCLVAALFLHTRR